MKGNHEQDIWITKKIYDDAEIKYYENVSKAVLTPLAGEVAKARQRLIESRDTFTGEISEMSSVDKDSIKFIEKKVLEYSNTINSIMDILKNLTLRVSAIEQNLQQNVPVHEIEVPKKNEAQKPSEEEDDDDVDLFGSDSEDEDEAAAKVREERLAAYHAKKAKKPVLIAKSNVILDIKPWDDETDMKVLESSVRTIETEGLLWGAAKLVPLAYGIYKLQISCVVEDDKVSIDWLTEQIEQFEDYVQSVDIAAFNKI